MQSDPSKQPYGNNFSNQYSAPMGFGNSYPSNNLSPAYAQYPQQPGYQPLNAPYTGQTAVYQPQNVVIMPVYRPVFRNITATPMTPNLKTFFILSGILCLICGILDIGLEIAILINSYWTYYRGLWAGGYLIGTGILMLVASCRTSFYMNVAIRTFAICLVLVIIGLILSVLNFVLANRCTYYSSIYCDNSLAINLKIAILGVFAFSTVHTITNIIVASNAQKNALLRPDPTTITY